MRVQDEELHGFVLEQLEASPGWGRTLSDTYGFNCSSWRLVREQVG